MHSASANLWLYIYLNFLFDLPNQELSGAKSSLQGGTVGVCSSYKRSGQPPYNWPFSLPSVYTTKPASVFTCAIRKALTNNKYEEKMHIEASKTIFLRSFQ